MIQNSQHTKAFDTVYAYDVWERLTEFLYSSNYSKLFVLVDSNTKIHCLPYFLKATALEGQCTVLEMPAGEKAKNIETCIALWKELSDLGADRNAVLINLGGGVLTDLGGFVACTFKRGIRFVNIPTSLLAMVDASVGGKNGIDLGIVKNQIGVIKPADFVLVDTTFLNSLPKIQVLSGWAEILKHGLIHSEEYWQKAKKFDLEAPAKELEIIWESILIKNEVVQKDPYEKDLRKTLNYGHTLGHAIESYFLHDGKKPLEHGEAVAIGIILANYISFDQFGFPKSVLDDATRVILSSFGRKSFSESDILSIIDYMQFDKKSKNGEVLFVLLENFGMHRLNCRVSNDLIFKSFEYYSSF